MPGLSPEFYYIGGGYEPVTETFDSYSAMRDWLNDQYDKKHDDDPEISRWNWRTYIRDGSVQIIARPDGGYVVHCILQHAYLSRDPQEIKAVHYATLDDLLHGRWTQRKRKAHFVASRAAQHA